MTSGVMLGQMEPEDCSDLFITEVVFENPIASASPVNSLATVDYKNVIELFNPTPNQLNLSNYSIVLTPESGNPLVLSLYGTIDARKTALISNFNSNSDITNVAEVLSNLVEFSGNVQIDLVKGGELIDRIGQSSANNPAVINIDSLLANPAYLNGQEVDLSSITNLSIRRNFGVTKGSLTFDPNTIAQEWAVFPSNVLDDLGQYQGACTDIWLQFSWDLNQSAFENEDNHLAVTIHYLNIMYNSSDPAWDNFAFDYKVDILENFSISSAQEGTDYTLETGAQDWTDFPYAQSNTGMNSDNERPVFNQIHLIEDGLVEDYEYIYIELSAGNVQNIPYGHQITVTDNNVFFTIKDGSNLDVEENEVLNQIPNLFNNTSIDINSISATRSEIYTITGQKVGAYTEKTIDVSAYKTGYYFLVLFNGKERFAKKILIVNDY